MNQVKNKTQLEYREDGSAVYGSVIACLHQMTIFELRAMHELTAELLGKKPQSTESKRIDMQRRYHSLKKQIAEMERKLVV